MINLQGDSARQFYGRIVNSWHRIENAYARKIYPVMSRQWRSVAADYEDGNYDINFSIANYTPQLRAQMAIYYRRAATIYYKLTLKMLGLKAIDTSREIKDTENIYWTYMRSWMAVETAKQIVMINQTTKQILQAIITSGVIDGLSYVQTAKKIRKLSLISNKHRAMTIARTEMHTAYSKSVNETIISSPTQVRTKEWMSVMDNRTRDPHITANGQTVPMDDYFIVWGESLQYPGDSNGSAGNVVNCRCITLYATK